MNQKLRELLGKAVWSANEAHRKQSLCLDFKIKWDSLPQEDKEALMQSGEAAVQAFLQVVLPSLEQSVAILRDFKE